MRRRDLFWLLALPVYYLINAFRHEMAHALSAILEGARVLGVILIPAWDQMGGINWGGAAWQGETSWVTYAMPYVFDLLTFLFFFYLCMAVPFQQRWVWVNLVAIGILSPLFNSAAAFFLLRPDVRALLLVFPTSSIDLYFLSSLALYLVGLFLTLAFSRTSLPSIPELDGVAA